MKINLKQKLQYLYHEATMNLTYYEGTDEGEYSYLRGLKKGLELAYELVKKEKK